MIATKNQTRYVKAELSGAGTYMIAVGHLVSGSLDRQKLSVAVQAMVERHDALRTVFRVSGGDIIAQVLPVARFGFYVIEPDNLDFETFRQQALPLIFNDVDPCSAGSLVRIVAADYGDSWRFTMAAHHAITDGFSRGVMNRELLKLYAGEQLPPVGSYYDFVSTDSTPPQLSREAKEIVETFPTPVRLVGDGASQGGTDDTGQVVKQDFQGLGRSLKMLAQQTQATRFGILTATYALAVQGFSYDRSVSSFFQSEGRKSVGAPNSVVGPFSNTLPIDISVDPDSNFAAFARRLSERTRQTVAHETEPLLDRILTEDKAPSISINMFPPTKQIRAGDLNVGPREFLDRRTEFDLNLVWAEERNTLSAHAYFDRSTLSEGRVTLFLDLLGRILDVAIENPGESCCDVMHRARYGHEAVLPQTCLTPTPKVRLHQPFFQTAEQRPEAIAITTTKGKTSYGELAKRARVVTAALQAAGVTAEDRVAILAQRDEALVEAVLGVSASGASFAIIDCECPLPRIRIMLDTLGARFLLPVGTKFPVEISAPVKVVFPDPSAWSQASVVNGPPRDQFCHLFTSGTTGQPKIVSHPDTTLLRFLTWQAQMLDLPNGITTMMLAGIAHDPTLRDVFLPLCHGGTIAIPTPEEISRPEALRALLADSECNVVRFSASTARLLGAGDSGELRCDTLKAIFWGGERLPRSSVLNWRTRAPQAKQFHVFGCTETPQAFLIHEINKIPDPLQRDIPLGRPLPWTGVWIVDEKGAAVSKGEVGEIVADLPDPVVGISQKRLLADATGACQHFTGDLGYQLSDGNIYFAGRRDGQVQINGYRVELREIEATVEAISGVDRALATLSEGRLLLFAQTISEEVDEAEVKAALARSLPSYMMPAGIFLEESFPIVRNGKVDREALIAGAVLSEQSEVEMPGDARPDGASEQAVADVYAKAAGRPVSDRSLSLFDLGADSLSTIEARIELEARGFSIPENWEWMPISQLALHCKEGAAADAVSGWYGQMRRLDTFIVLRSIAITLVVAHHSGWELGVGASLILLALAGYTFGRMHLPAILEDGRTGRVWALMAKLLIPLVPASVLIYAVHSHIGNSPHLATLLFYENVANFVDEVILGIRNNDHHVIWLWFLHAYLQIFLLLGVLLGIPSLRRRLAVDPWRGALLFFVVAEIVGAGLISLLSGSFYQGGIIHVSSLLQRSPTTLLPFFALGVLFAFSNTSQRRIVAVLLGVLHFVVAQFVFVHNEEVAWLLALCLCAFIPSVALPRILTTIVVTISGYALMIYLSHRAVYFGLEFYVPDLLPVPAEIVLQIAVGVLLGVALRPVFDRLGINRLSNMQITFGRDTQASLVNDTAKKL